MVKKKHNQTKTISNRRARHDYELGDSLVVGMELSGAETKSLRMGHGQLRGAYVTLKGSELYLINATISPSSGIPISESDQTRARKLLAKHREINSLMPLEILAGGRYIKLRIAVGRGKKLYDKRQTLKSREHARQAAAAVKQSYR
jgi:SsrA-binding protein